MRMSLVYLVCLLSLVWCGFCEVVEPVPVAVPVDSHIATEQTDDTGGGASGRPAIQEFQDAIRKLIAQDSALRLSQWENEEGFNHNYAVFKQPQQDVHGDGPREVHVEKRQAGKGFSEWGKWSECSATCGQATKQRTRTCEAKKCKGARTGKEKCEVPACAGGAVGWTEWGAWSACSATCGMSLRERSRQCDAKKCKGPGVSKEVCLTPVCGAEESNTAPTSTSPGAPSGDKTESVSTTPSGPATTTIDVMVSGVWSEWGAWSPCSATCGMSLKERTRQCDGQSCSGDSVSKEVCVVPACGAGQGSMSTTASLASSHVASTTTSPADREHKPGKDTDKDENSGSNHVTDPPGKEKAPKGWTEWGAWSACSATCGTSLKERTRTCNGKKKCKGATTSEEKCQVPTCKDDTPANQEEAGDKPTGGKAPKGWTEWGAWSECSATCGTSVKERTRQCNGNKKCKGPKTSEEVCVVPECGAPPGDAPQASPGGTEGPHTTTPSGKASPGVTGGPHTTTSSGGANPGDDTGTLDEGPDHETPPDDKEGWGEWGAWSECSATCGMSLKDRTRQCDGKECKGPKTSKQVCVVPPCGQAGITNSVSAAHSTESSPSTKPTEKDRQPVTTKKPTPAKTEAPDVWSEWGPWSPCSATCGMSLKVRNRKCDGNKCKGPQTSKEVCAVPKCGHNTKTTLSASTAAPTKGNPSTKPTEKGKQPVVDNASTTQPTTPPSTAPPVWGEWASWSPCSATCGMAVKKRTRTCTGGGCKGPHSSMEVCVVPPCQQEHISTTSPATVTNSAKGWSEWEAWSGCSATCGTSIRERTRQCGTKMCKGSHTSKEECTVPQCAVHQHSSTSNPAGSNNEVTSTVHHTTVHVHHSSTTQTASSSTAKPNVKGWSEWGSWSECSATCGMAIKQRTRKCSDKKCKGSKTGEEICVVPGCAAEETRTSSTSTVTPGGVDVTASPSTTVYIISESTPKPSTTQKGTISDETDDKSDEQNDKSEEDEENDKPPKAWGEWSACSLTCGDGERSRSKECKKKKACKDKEVETETCGSPCPTTTTPQDDEESDTDKGSDSMKVWGDWTPCSMTCGSGQRTRFKECKKKRGCKDYEDDDVEVEFCGPPCSPSTTTILQEAVSEQESSEYTHQAYHHQTDHLDQDEDDYQENVHGSYQAQYQDNDQGTDEDKDRNPESDGESGDEGDSYLSHPWSQWSSCSQTCGIGVQTKSRLCNEGVDHCEGTSQTRHCILESCTLGNRGKALKTRVGEVVNLDCQAGRHKPSSETYTDPHEHSAVDLYWITPGNERITEFSYEERMKIKDRNLLIDHVTRADSGSYHCVIQRRDDTFATSDVNLVVQTCFEDNPCQNGGTCTDLADMKGVKHGAFTCSCRSGFKGEYCQEKTESLMMAMVLVVVSLGILVSGLILLRCKRKKEEDFRKQNMTVGPYYDAGSYPDHHYDGDMDYPPAPQSQGYYDNYYSDNRQGNNNNYKVFMRDEQHCADNRQANNNNYKAFMDDTGSTDTHEKHPLLAVHLDSHGQTDRESQWETEQAETEAETSTPNHRLDPMHRLKLSSRTSGKRDKPDLPLPPAARKGVRGNGGILIDVPGLNLEHLTDTSITNE